MTYLSFGTTMSRIFFCHDRITYHFFFDRKAVVVFHLVHIPAHFAAGHIFCSGVVKEKDSFCSVYQPIEIVCVDTVLMFCGRQVESFAQIIRNEGRGDFFHREDTFVHR